MTRDGLIEVIRNALWRQIFAHDEDAETIEYQKQVWDYDWDRTLPKAKAMLSAIEAAGVRLVYPSEARAQLIDGDERTTVRIFTPYAPANPGATTGIRKAETPCSDCIDGCCQMNCGPKVG